MAALTPVTLKRATDGISLAGVAAAGGGDTFENTGKEFVVINNGGGGAITLTVATPTTVDGLAVADLTASVGAGAIKAVGPFPPSIYGETVSLSYSGVTSVSVAVARFP